MRKHTLVLALSLGLATTTGVALAQDSSQQSTPTKKPGLLRRLGGDTKKGLEDVGKGAEKVGKGAVHGVEEVGEGTKKGAEWVGKEAEKPFHHKPKSSTTSTPSSTTGNTTGQSSN